uniref:Uncharacterized protein n=2 Tax=unclassified Caudoviricetes TaxID=2788787 RepID=A0A8S5PJR9_9CAUD|nr:MAG TPA: hypothetical protein [Siphoviridae sp. ctJcm18]DAE06657.1 MAG TPA: hypothetical protein [Siphoviridae sp. ctUGQ45]
MTSVDVCVILHSSSKVACNFYLMSVGFTIPVTVD